MKKTIFITLLISSIFAYSTSSGNNDNYLSFRHIINDNSHFLAPGYVDGKRLFPEFLNSGLSENFLIKNKPDIVLSDNDIEKIEIIRMGKMFPGDEVSYNVHIVLNKEAKKKETISISPQVGPLSGPTVSLIIPSRMWTRLVLRDQRRAATNS